MTLIVSSSFVRRVRVVAAALALGVSATGCSREQSTDPPFEPTLDLQLRESMEGWGFVVPIAEVPKQNAALVELGRSLFFDKELSGNRDMSCASCHDPDASLTDRMSLAVGTGGTGTGTARLPGQGRQFIPRNAPTLLNQGLAFPYLFWEGRLTEGGFGSPLEQSFNPTFPPGLNSLLARQAMLPVLNRGEMRGERGDRDRFGKANELAELADADAAGIWAATMRRLMAITEYVAKFNSAFPGVPNQSLGFQHAANAIAAFQLEMFTKTNSPFDRFLRRDTRPMSDEAKRGGLLFFGKARCVQCHSGPLLGGQQFANIGIPQFGPGMGKAAPLDIGRAELFSQSLTAPQPYEFAFRVPMLRNVELTAPYMHNGAYPTLEAVVRHYTNADSALQHFDLTQIDPVLRGTHRADAGTIAKMRQSLDFRVRQSVPLSATEQRELVAFLKSLTDPAARNLSAVVPQRVPSGLPVRE